MTDSQFSLLLPVYRGDSAEFLERAFRSSVFDQTTKPDEVVLVQDGPVPGPIISTIARLIRTSPVPVQLVVLPENRGLAEALTRGLAACSYEVVARMDADDISEPTRFEVQLGFIARGYELVGTGMREFHEDGSGEHIGVHRIPPTDPRTIREYARFHDPFNHPTVMYAKTAVERAGSYVPLGMMEDYWLFVRMIASGAAVINSAEPLVRYRVSSGAYKRRGGLRLLKSEFQLQYALRRSGFTSRRQFARNLAVRGGYRLIPEGVRRRAYRTFILGRQEKQ